MSSTAQVTTNDPANEPDPGLADFSDLDLTDGGEEITIASPVEPSSQDAPLLSQAPSGEPSVPSGVQPQAASQPVAIPAAPVEPAATPVPAPAPTVTPVAAAPVVQPTGDPSAQPISTEEMVRRRETFIDSVAARYTLSEEDRNQMIAEPEKYWPKVIARTVVDTYDMVRAAVTRQMPTIIEGHLRTNKEADANGTAFFQRWPGLNKPELHEGLVRLVRGYRQANPQLSTQQVIEEAGAAAHMAFRIPYEAQPVSTTPAGPQAAPTGAVPYRPAAPGGAPPASAATSENFWETLAREALE